MAAKARPLQTTFQLESEGFTVARAQRYAMYYKHEPSWVTRLLSLSVLNFRAWLGFDLGNALIDRWGSKMTDQAVGVGKN